MGWEIPGQPIAQDHLHRGILLSEQEVVRLGKEMQFSGLPRMHEQADGLLGGCNGILGRMQQNQPVSIKTIDSWIQAGMTMPGNRARSIACAAALQDLVARGAIRRQDGGYAPGVTEG